MDQIIQSLLVYTFFAIFLFALGMVARRREKIGSFSDAHSSFWTWEIIASLLLFSLISGIRWNVGVDHLAYLSHYRMVEIYESTGRDFEIGFSLITKWMASAGFHYTFYFGFLAFLQIVFVYKAFEEERYVLPFIALIAVLGVHYLSWMNGIRQMLAATVFLFSIGFVHRRHWIAYFSCIIFASLFHKSALLLMPFYFFPVKDIFKHRSFVFAASLVSIFIGQSNSWIGAFSGVIDGLATLIDYDRFRDLDVLLADSHDRSFGPRKIMYLMLTALIVWRSKELKKRFSGTKFITYYNLFIIGFLSSNVLDGAHHTFLRIASYFTIFQLPVAAYMLCFYFEKGGKNPLPFFLVTVLSCSHTPASAVADYGLGDRDYSNFRFFWSNDNDIP